jgi:hypothetical protein
MNMNIRLVAALLVLGAAAVPALAENDYAHASTTSSNQAITPSAADAVTTQSNSGAPTYSVPDAARHGKTHEQVYQELVQAEQEGLVPVSRYDYPPSARTIERNRERYAATHGGSVAADAN